MKKLTAGIFASILGLTAIGAADAAVPSTKYVDDAVKAVASDVSELNTTVQGHTTQIADLQGADTTLQGNINTLTTNTTNALAGKANTADLKQVAFTADYNDLLNVPAGQAPLTDTQLQAVNSGITVDKVVAYDAVAADYVTEQELTNSQTTQNAEIKTAYEAADATTLQAAKDYADQNDDDTLYDDTEVRGLISGNTTEINTIKGEQTTQDQAIQALQNANYITGDALNGYATENWVETKGYATKAEAEGYANAKDTAISAAQTAATEAKDAASAADTKAGNAQTTANEAKNAAAANATAIEGKLSSDTAAATYELKANVSGAPNDTEAGKYVLTKIVTEGEGGVEVVSYGWELIDRDYDPASESAGGTND